MRLWPKDLGIGCNTTKLWAAHNYRCILWKIYSETLWPWPLNYIHQTSNQCGIYLTNIIFFKSMDNSQITGPSMNIYEYFHLKSLCDFDLWATEQHIFWKWYTIMPSYLKIHILMTMLWTGQPSVHFHIKTFLVHVRPWPLCYRPGYLVWSFALLRYICKLSYIKIHP